MKMASRKKKSPSTANGMPNAAPKRPMKVGHNNPNSNVRTVPVTAPTANVTAMYFDQRCASSLASASSRLIARQVRDQRHERPRDAERHEDDVEGEGERHLGSGPRHRVHSQQGGQRDRHSATFAPAAGGPQAWRPPGGQAGLDEPTSGPNPARRQHLRAWRPAAPRGRSEACGARVQRAPNRPRRHHRATPHDARACALARRALEGPQSPMTANASRHSTTSSEQSATR